MTQFKRLLGQALAVTDLDAAIASFERLGLVLASRSSDRYGGVTIARLPFADGGYLELVGVDDADRWHGRVVADFLADSGEGMFRVDLEVDDLAAVRDSFDADGPAGGDHHAIPSTLGPLFDGADGSRRCAVEWPNPSSIGGARFDLVDASSVTPDDCTDTWWLRIYNQAVAVPEIVAAIEAFEALDQPLWDRSGRADWGLDTAVFRQTTGSAVEFVSPTDESRPTGAAIAAFMAKRGGGHYMPVYEVADVDEVHRRLESAGIRTLGPPTVTPPESPWGELRQMWVHPKLTHGAFVEFLSVPA